MSSKTKAVSHVGLACVCAMSVLTQPAATEEQEPAVAAVGPTVSRKAGEKMTFESITPNLIVNDIDRSTAFYRDVLGFQQVTTVPEEPPFVFVWMKQGSVDVFLNIPQPKVLIICSRRSKHLAIRTKGYTIDRTGVAR